MLSCSHLGILKLSTIQIYIFFVFQVDAARGTACPQIIDLITLDFAHLVMFQLLFRSASKMLYEF